MEFSIIVPTYKPNNYLFELVDCLTDQTYDYSLWEIVLVLNGPRNPYYKRINDFINKIDQINIVLYYTEKKGVSSARNIGIKVARGKYLGFIDDDDLISLDYIESLVLNIKPDGIVCSNVRIFKDNIEYNDSDYLSLAFQNNLIKKSQMFILIKVFFR